MIDKILNALKEDLKALFQGVLESDMGINDKVGVNTLVNSNLHDEVSVTNNFNVFTIFYNDYLEYIESGRKPLAKRVPIGVLVNWMRRKGISNDVKVAYAIQQSIFYEGISPRPFFPVFEDDLDRMMEQYLDKIFEGIITNLNNYFSN